ncbi:hypothetical protein Cylst_5700 [Cylindrospermum stagnale PCC 7417]|uniref:Uncharacterized protein n=1 Tax=Cylindrospermum stagnale PCC 7417 TaxID=56107 RepID=K9X6J3_9NOST|nr:hypothetical protein Cylst_5700 [Cylindrospermum stagnale PCC 7417]
MREATAKNFLGLSPDNVRHFCTKSLKCFGCNVKTLEVSQVYKWSGSSASLKTKPTSDGIDDADME